MNLLQNQQPESHETEREKFIKLRIEIEDNGQGIPMEKQKLLF